MSTLAALPNTQSCTGEGALSPSKLEGLKAESYVRSCARIGMVQQFTEESESSCSGDADDDVP